VEKSCNKIYIAVLCFFILGCPATARLEIHIRLFMVFVDVPVVSHISFYKIRFMLKLGYVV